MATTIELCDQNKVVDFGNDAVVCPLFISGIRGGRSLDVSGVSATYLKAGHVIIKTSDNVYKPMPVSDSKYGTLPEGCTYVGVLYKSIPTDTPLASIMTNGEVNSVTVPYPMTDIQTAFAAACPHIVFVSASADAE